MQIDQNDSIQYVCINVSTCAAMYNVRHNDDNDMVSGLEISATYKCKCK